MMREARHGDRHRGSVRRSRARALLAAIAAVALLGAMVTAGAAAGHGDRFDKQPVPPIGEGDSPYAHPGGPVDDGATGRGKPLQIDRDGDGNPYVAGEILVSFEPDAGGGDKRVVRQDADATLQDRFGPIDAQLLEVPEIEDRGAAKLDHTLDGIESGPGVESAGPNYVGKTNAVFNDPDIPLLWGLTRIRAFQAWDRTVGSGTLINDLDSGIVVNGSCNPNAAHEDIGGVISQFDFFHGGTDDCAEDNNLHGTHTAGTAAAVTDNGAGIAGVSPGASLLIGKVCEDSGGGLGGAATCPISAQINGLIAAGNLPDGGIPRPDVINMSLGGTGTTQAHHDAVKYATGKGIVLVAAAGNENENAFKYPAAYPEAIAVASTNINNGKSAFSNFGSWVDIAAPGGDFSNPAAEDILSTIPPGPSTYAYLNGTSMSAPHVTGVASLIAAQGRSASRIRYRLESGAKDIGPVGKDDLFGSGLLDAAESTLPAAQTKACAAANQALAAARAPLDGLREAVDTATTQHDKAKKKVKKAKRAKKGEEGRRRRAPTAS